MILIGQYDSPFVRRVAVAMNFYGTPFKRRISSVFTEFDEILEINPLGKVPILQLDNGETSKQEKAIRGKSFPKLEKHRMHCEALPEFRKSAYSAAEAERSGWRPSE